MWRKAAAAILLLVLGAPAGAGDFDFGTGSSATSRSGLRGDFGLRMVRIDAQFSWQGDPAQGRVTLTVHGWIQPGYYIYSVAQPKGQGPGSTRMGVESPYLVPVGAIRESPPVSVWDRVFELQMNVHKGVFWIARDYKLTPDSASFLAANGMIEGAMTYNVCDNRICSLDKHLPIRALLPGS